MSESHCNDEQVGYLTSLQPGCKLQTYKRMSHYLDYVYCNLFYRLYCCKMKAESPPVSVWGVRLDATNPNQFDLLL